MSDQRRSQSAAGFWAPDEVPAPRMSDQRSSQGAAASARALDEVAVPG